MKKRLSDKIIVQMIALGGRDRERAFLELLRIELSDQSISKVLSRLGIEKDFHNEIVDDSLMALNQIIIEKRFKDEANPYAYMVGVAKNLGLHFLRTRRRYHDLKSKYALEINSELTTSIDSLIIEKEERQQLLNIIDQLSPSCRQIILLSIIKEKSNFEIMEALGYQNDQVIRSKKSKCMRSLIDLIKKSNFGK